MDERDFADMEKESYEREQEALDQDCPECGAYVISTGMGVKCSKCDWWECF
jgi:tRNA(Ile2) C34 agmatinyltransferase TiaS